MLELLMINRNKKLILVTVLAVALCGCGSDSDQVQPELNSKLLLGSALFHDVKLSKNGTQSCATCHNPDKGFADSRGLDGELAELAFAASLGDDGSSLGDRNAPTAAYAALSPEFQKGSRDRVGQQQVTRGSYEGYLGGQFWDGREANLAGQAGGPPTNPLEMGMENKAAVVSVLIENDKYVAAFESLYSENIFDDVDNSYAAMADAIAQFETLDEAQFLAFDSKYDQTLAFPSSYQYQTGSKAALGETLFFSSDFSCASCHQLNSLRNRKEPFTGFEYHNIGVPNNSILKAERDSRGIENALATDQGLFNNPNVLEADKESSKGKFKVPTLRNVALTAPYMHNGVFNTLQGVLAFYEHAKLRGRHAQGDGEQSTIINPETGVIFDVPELDQNIAHVLLGSNQNPLTAEKIAAIECFLLTLTDAKYEHLLDATKVASCGI